MKNFLIISFFYLIKPLLISLKSYQTFCVNKDIQKNDMVKLSFQCMGEIENIIFVYLKNREKNIHHNSRDNSYTNRDEFEVKSIGGVYTLCFESKYKYDTVISFDINTLHESGHIVNIVQDGNIIN
jgi:hypothetical protein